VIILGIETSCDETACGIVTSDGKLLANVLYSQIEEHLPYGGVVPEIAARAHLEKIGPIVTSALREAQLALQEVDLIAYTRGPGLMGPLLVGASFARGMASSLGIPSAGINHLEGHIAAVRLSHPELNLPFVALTVSGGHTQLDYFKADGTVEPLGRTRDDAAGEAFDKGGKLLGLGYPAGPIISRRAAEGNRKFISFPRAFRGVDTLDFSFSGFKSAVMRVAQTTPPAELKLHLNDICASLEEAIVDMLVERSLQALKQCGEKNLVVGGGVSANQRLREKLSAALHRRGAKGYFPSSGLSTDNGAMIAAAALYRYKAGTLPQTQEPIKPNLALGH